MRDHHRTLVRIVSASLGLTLTAAVAGCGSGSATLDGAELASSADCTPEDGPLRVYTNDWGATMTDKFTADTGIPAEVADLGGGELLARVAAEANNPQWDVVVLDGHGSLEALDRQNQLVAGHTLENVDNLTDAGRTLLPDDNAWVPISEHAAAVLAYNTERIDPDDAPQHWSDLTDPRYAPVGIADPAAAAPAYPAVSWFFQHLGIDDAERYFDTLIDNGFNTYDRNGPVAEAVASGEVPVAMLQEHNVYDLIDDGEPVEAVWPDEGAPAAVRTAGISAETPHPCASQVFTDWLLEPDTMDYLMAEGGTDSINTPYVDGVDTSPLPDRRPDDPDLNVTDAGFAADNESRIKDWFAERMASR